MPKRIKKHEIEDISRAKFQLALPRKWVFREKSRDYGIDGEVEIFDVNDNSTGLVFWVQLKATESKTESTILHVDFKIHTLRYYKSLDIPVLLVRYSLNDDTIFIKWISNIDLFFAKENAKTFRIKLSTEDKWTDSSSLQIENYLKNVRLLKSGSFRFPLPLSISIKTTKVHSISKEILLTQIKKDLQPYSDFVFPSVKDNTMVEVFLDNDELKISLLELNGCSFHSISSRTKDDFSKGLAQDILLGISVAMVQLGQIEYAGRIIFENRIEFRLLEKQELLFYLLKYLSDSSYFERMLELIGNFLDKEESTELDFITQVNLIFASGTKNEKRNEAIEEFLKSRLEKAKSIDNDLQKGICHYNMGNHYCGRNQFDKSIHHYNLARKFAPIYLNQNYYFSEIASMLFRLGKFKMASKLYSKSLDLKKDYNTVGLHADSLMFEGEYKKALIGFEEYFHNTEKPNDEFILKIVCLHSFINKYKIEKQLRDGQKAKQFADISNLSIKENPINYIEKAFKHDLLSGLAWFNLGIVNSSLKDFESAAFCFLMAALVENDDIEAWKHATKCAFNSEEIYQFLPHIIRTGYFFHREEYLVELYSHLENHHKSETTSVLMNWIQEILPVEENTEFIPKLRILNEKGEFEDLEELIKKTNNN